MVLVGGFAVHLVLAPAHPWVLLACFAASPARSARPPPKGAPLEPREYTLPDGGGLLVVLSGLVLAVAMLIN